MQVPGGSAYIPSFLMRDTMARTISTKECLQGALAQHLLEALHDGVLHKIFAEHMSGGKILGKKSSTKMFMQVHASRTEGV